MAKCKNCKNLKYKDDGRERYAWCPFIGDNPDLEFQRYCGAYKTMSQGDKIRNMSDEELAEFLGTKLDVTSLCENLEDGCWYTCETRECGYDEARLILKWLKSEVGCE